MIDARTKHWAARLVTEKYKTWQYQEAITHPEYNGMDEEVYARSAQGEYEGALQLAQNVLLIEDLDTPVRNQQAQEELIEEIKERIDLNQRILDQAENEGYQHLPFMKRLAHPGHEAAGKLEEDERALEGLNAMREQE